MHRDPTQFRERFKRWKAGLPVYKNGRSVDDPIQTKDNNNIYFGGNALGEGNELVVTGRKPSVYQLMAAQHAKAGGYRSAFDGNAVKDALGLVPIVSDVMDGVDAAKEAVQGNYTSAAMLGAGLLMPNVLEKPLKLISKGLKNALLDYRFAKAIKKKHIQTLKQLRDKHFLDSAPSTVLQENDTPITLYHGTPTKGWHSYDSSKFGLTDDGYYGKGMYLSDELKNAKGYAYDFNNNFGEVKSLYGNIQHPFYSGMIKNKSIGEGTKRTEMAYYFGRNLDKLAAMLLFELQTGKLFPEDLWKELINSDASVFLFKNYPFNEVVIPKTSVLKYADPITRDDNGKLIKLSKRDDFSNPDFRY